MAATPKTHREAAQDTELAALARALGHPARVHILRLLCSRDACVAGELADELPLAASTVSQHLKVLNDAGLIEGEVDGPRRCYQPSAEALGRLSTLLDALQPSPNSQRSCR